MKAHTAELKQYKVVTHPFIMDCSHKELQLDMQTIKLTKKLLK